MGRAADWFIPPAIIPYYVTVTLHSYGVVDKYPVEAVGGEEAGNGADILPDNLCHENLCPDNLSLIFAMTVLLPRRGMSSQPLAFRFAL
jgi:hypothetical protein